MKRKLKGLLGMAVMVATVQSTAGTIPSMAAEKTETEDNNRLEKASSLSLNENMKGSLSDEDDVDFYKFEIPDDGKVSITFKHEYAKGSFTTDEAILWKSQIYNAEGENLLVSENYDEYAGKNKEEQEGRTIGLPRGTYYLKVESDSYSGKEYMLKVNVSVPDMGWINMLDGKSYWYEGKVRQGTYDDPQGVLGDGTVRGREICDMSQKDDAGQDGVWFWLDSVYNGAKATGK